LTRRWSVSPDAVHSRKEVFAKDSSQLGQPRLALPKFKISMEDPFYEQTFELAVVAGIVCNEKTMSHLRFMAPLLKGSLSTS
jgi:hypothetical protein